MALPKSLEEGSLSPGQLHSIADPGLNTDTLGRERAGGIGELELESV